MESTSNDLWEFARRTTEEVKSWSEWKKSGWDMITKNKESKNLHVKVAVGSGHKRKSQEG